MMRRSSATGVAMVFVAATLMATNVAANDGDGAPPQPEGETYREQLADDADFEAQADSIFGIKLYNVNGADFIGSSETVSFSKASDSGRCVRTGLAGLYAPVELPHGSEVLGVTLFADDADAAGDIDVTFREHDFSTAGDSVTNLFDGETGTAFADGYSSFALTDLGEDNVLDKNTEDFFLFAFATTESADLRLCNVQIAYIPPLSGGLEFHSIDPCAIFDTRSGSGSFNGKLTSDEVITVDAISGDYSAQGGFAGGCGIASAGGLFSDGELLTKAIAINLVALDAEGSGNLKAWANGVAEPPGGVLVYETGINNGNEFALNVQGGLGCGLLCVDNGGLFKVKNNSSSPVHVRGVVVGYFTQVNSNQ